MCNAKKLPGIEMANWQAERRDSSPLISLLPEQEILTSSHSIVSPKEFQPVGRIFHKLALFALALSGSCTHGAT
jgi:hypothetical protein